MMNKRARSLAAVGMLALAASLGVSGMVATSVAAPGGPAPAASHPDHHSLPDVASVQGRPETPGRPMSLGEALARPHGVGMTGVTPEGSGVNNGRTKQAPGLALKKLRRGEQDAGVNEASRTGGCAQGYSDGRSCLPVAPPSAAQNPDATWTCDELLTLFPQGIPLQTSGVDPLGLDEDGNGTACA